MTGPTPPDLLVVFAGATFRKEFAVRAWREGAARALVVAIARFEWRKVPALGLPGDGGLVAIVDATPPPRRLFVLIVEGDRVEARLVPKGRWGTWSEAKAFAALIRERNAKSVAVCTSGYHLPRSIQAVRRALAANPAPADHAVELQPLAATEPPESFLTPSRWWRSWRAWRALAREAVKRVIYGVGVPMMVEPPEPVAAPPEPRRSN